MEQYDVLPRCLEHTIHCPPRGATLGVSDAGGTNGTDRGEGHHPYPKVTCIATSVQYLATGTADGRIIIWPVSQRTPVEFIEVGSTSQRVDDLAWSPDGRFLFSVIPGEGGVVLRVWDVRTYGNDNITSEVGSVSMHAAGAVKFGGVVCVDAEGVRAVDASPAPSPARRTPNKRCRKDMERCNGSKSAKGTRGEALTNGDKAECHVRALVTDVEGGGLHWLVVKRVGGSYTLDLAEVTLHGWDTPRHIVVGDRCELHWEDNDPPMWFAGTVAQVDPRGKRIFVFYDDGQALWEDLEGPEALQWRKTDGVARGSDPLLLPSPSDRTETVDYAVHPGQPHQLTEEQPSTSSGTAVTVAVLCGKNFDHLAVLDGPATRLRLYVMQGADGFRLVDELITNERGKRPSHIAVSPDGLCLAVTHPLGNVFAYSVNSGDDGPSPGSPNRRQGDGKTPLAMVGQLDWHSYKGKQGAKQGDRCHTWHCCTFAPDSSHIFCSMTLDHEPKRHPVVIWDHVGGKNKRLLESSTDGVPHMVTSLCAHPHCRPMELFALSSSGLVVIWASRLVQNWSVIDQGFESFEQNRSHIEREDDFDVTRTGAVELVQDDDELVID